MKRRIQIRACFATILGILAGPLTSVESAARSFDTIAFSGQAAPGAAPHHVFTQFNKPSINNAGQVAFTATVQGFDVGSFNDRGIWAGGLGSLDLVAREGDDAPGAGPNIFFNSFENPNINDAGHVAFRGLMSGPGVSLDNNQAVWSNSGAGLQMAARERQQAPGTEPGTVFFTPGGAGLTNTGRTTFLAQLISNPIDTTANAGMWTTRDGDLRLLMRQGQQAPGLADGVTFKSLQSATISDFGFVGIRPTLQGPGIDSTNDQGIWVENNGALQLVVREGDAAPGQPAGARFSTIFPQAMNNDNRVAFRGRTSGGVNDGIWSNGNGDLAPVALAGESAPDVGLNFTTFFNPVLNEDGDTAFVGRFGSGSGLFSEGHDGLHLVAATGEPAPGVEDGALFGNFANPTFPANFVLNGNGDVAFLSPLLNTPHAQGIFAEIDGLLSLIVQKGDQIEVAPGDFRTVSFLSFDGVSGNQNAQSSAFNDVGQITFAADFTDGSAGVFVFNTIPEPSALSLLVVGMAAFARRRR